MDSEEEEEEQEDRKVKLRNLSGFWLLGLFNNFSYVIMLSAAHDILTPTSYSNNTTEKNATDNRTGMLVDDCNPISTGAILLADILPALLIKVTAPFYIQRIAYRIKIIVVILLATASFLCVALGGANLVWLSVIGVMCASISSGLGELTFLGLSTHFNKNCVSTWSSGTGSAGLFGALSYAGLTSIGVTPAVSLLLMLIVPVLMTITYFVLLVKPRFVDSSINVRAEQEQEHQVIMDNETSDSVQPLTFVQKLSLVKPLLKFMIPLLIVYFCEYFINQGLIELVAYDGIWLKKSEQYRWYQVIYQLGVFISRSSVNVVPIRHVEIFPAFQIVNVIVITLQIFLKFIPNIWIVFAIILFEGLLGGGAYVNSFYRIRQEIRPEHVEYSIGVTCISDALGISLAAAVAIPVHNYICTLPE